MSLLELFGARRDPGPEGSVEWKHPEESGDDPGTIVLRAVLAIVVCALILWWAYDPAAPWSSVGRAAGSLSGYVLLCAVLSPQPDTTNLGWFGGVIDNPLRWSDDYNRILLFLLILITPGRLVAAALLDGVRLLRSRSGSGLPRARL